jgi:hypothetical protein
LALDLVEARFHVGDKLAMLPERVELGASEDVGDRAGAEVEDALALDGRELDGRGGLGIAGIGELSLCDEARRDWRAEPL